MKFISKDEFQTLQGVCLEAVRRAESRTTGEIVPVFVHRADFYPVAHYRAGLLLALTLGCATIGLSWTALPMPWPLHELVALSMGLGLAIGHLLAYVSGIKRWFLTARDKRFEVRQRAIECFHDLGVHNTPKRNGVLLFIAELEKRIEILPDVGFHGKVDNKAWQQVQKNLSQELRHKRITSGLVQAIEGLGEILTQHFPAEGPRQASDNRIADQLSDQTPHNK